MIGYLQWFDVSSGEGMMLVQGKSVYLHYTCINGIAKNNYIAPSLSDQILLTNLKPGSKAKVTLYSNLYMTQIETADFDLESGQ